MPLAIILVMSVAEKTDFELRRELRDGDAEAIVEIHERIYRPEYGMDTSFVDGVRFTVEDAVERGWPKGGGAWLVDGSDGLAGSLGLTDEGDGLGKLRWVVLAPEARGTGLGKRMITEAVSAARGLGFVRLELDTFGALKTAAAIYRSVGFKLIGEEQTDIWGPMIAYQDYVLDLGAQD
jgi:GNAT superfamily N-acetyltransferase